MRWGLGLGFAEALGGWGPAMGCAVLLWPRTHTDGQVWALLGVVLVVALSASVVLSVGRPSGLVDHALDSGWHWLGYPFALPFFVSTDWTESPLAWIALASAAVALVAGVAQATLGWRARGWLTGTLRGGDAPRIDAGGTTYALRALPRGAHDGDPVTVPSVRLLAREADPYRSGRPVGIASGLWIVDGRRLARALTLRGGLLIAWALATGARVACGATGDFYLVYSMG